MLDRVRFGGTLLFHFELGHPWSLALPARPYALFHYLSRGSATLALEEGRDLPHEGGRLCRRHPRRAPFDLFGSSNEAFSACGLRSTDRTVSASFVTAEMPSRSPTMICGNFTVSRPARGGVLELLPPVLLLRPLADGDWLGARSATHGERVGA